MLGATLVETVDREELLWEVLTRKLPQLLCLFNVRLIIIDSIAVLFRVLRAGGGVGGSEGEAAPAYVHRAVQLFRVAALLKRIAHQQQCWVVIANQVTDVFAKDPPPGRGSSLHSAIGRGGPTAVQVTSPSGGSSPPSWTAGVAPGARALEFPNHCPSPNCRDAAAPATSASLNCAPGSPVIAAECVPLRGAAANGASGSHWGPWPPNGGGGVRPALGLAWSNCVDVRLSLIIFSTASLDGPGGRRRGISLAFAPYVGPSVSAVPFSIGAGGLQNELPADQAAAAGCHVARPFNPPGAGPQLHQTAPHDGRFSPGCHRRGDFRRKDALGAWGTREEPGPPNCQGHDLEDDQDFIL
eukprot:GHVT01036274.1.p1 GENE.GHVT01036274.1~~GHVT01036274.1.p1  ORF type:complete len:393 (+),score=88.63 GHVT01036274.1:116-1180(+)